MVKLKMKMMIMAIINRRNSQILSFSSFSGLSIAQFYCYHLFLVLVLMISTCVSASSSSAGGVIRVSSKFSGTDRSLSALKAHDTLRHFGVFAGVDLPLGGTGRPDAVG